MMGRERLGQNRIGVARGVAARARPALVAGATEPRFDKLEAPLGPLGFGP